MSQARGANGYVLVSVSEEEGAGPYLAALMAAGISGERLRVVSPPPGPPGEVQALAAIPELAAGASGVVLCGGVDVAPSLYGEEVLAGAGVEVVAERDALEWQLLEGARAARVPVWGVCRGLQMINVFLGGSLWQDLPLQSLQPCPPRRTPVSHAPPAEKRLPLDTLSHELRVTAPGAPMGMVLARETPRVNSRHHQGIKQLAAELMAVAEAPDGLVEAAVLGSPGWWLRGVQWHPENLVAHPQQRALWDEFAQAVSTVRPAPAAPPLRTSTPPAAPTAPNAPGA